MLILAAPFLLEKTLYFFFSISLPVYLNCLLCFESGAPAKCCKSFEPMNVRSTQPHESRGTCAKF